LLRGCSEVVEKLLKQGESSLLFFGSTAVTQQAAEQATQQVEKKPSAPIIGADGFFNIEWKCCEHLYGSYLIYPSRQRLRSNM